MQISKFSINRPVTISMMILIIVVFGAISFFRIPVDFLPELEFPAAAVMTTYSGAAPEEVENLITKWIEETVNTVDNVKKVTSFSQEGMSIVAVEFNWGTKMDFAAQDLREKVDLIKMRLPEDADKPIIVKFDPADMPIIWMGVSSNQMDGRTLRDYAEDVLKDKLERIPGVAAAYVLGGDTREILVSVDKNKLEAYGLSIDLISNKLRMENKNLPGGKMKTLYKEYLVRSVGEFQDIDEIRNIPLANVGGNIVKLKHVASVTDTNKEKNDVSRLNGSPSVGIAIMKQTGVNTLEVSDKVHEVIDELKKDLPGDSSIAISFDQGLYVRRSAEYLVGNLKAGAIFAMVVVFLFLRNIRTTIMIGLSIPISIIATFILIFFKGMTLNAMSMGGLALGVGMLVDNSIVVLESIYRHFARGEERNSAADIGATEVGMPIFASTLTTVAVFLPIAFTTGIAGKIFQELAWTVSFSLFASLFVALTIVPMLASKILVLSEREKHFEERLKRTKGVYYKIIEYALGHRFKIIFAAILLFAGSLFLAKQIGMEFIEQSDASEVVINFEMPKGTSLKETDRVMTIFEQEALKMTEVQSVFILMGFNEDEAGGDPGMVGQEQGSNTGFMVISLKSEGERNRNINQIIDILRSKADIPGLKMKFQETMQAILAMGTPIQLKIYGKELDLLGEISNKIYQAIKDIPGLVDLNVSAAVGKPEINISFNRDKLADFNLSVDEVAKSVETSIKGEIATWFREAGDEHPIRVRMNSSQREELEDIKALPITSMTGKQMSLDEIATVYKTSGPSMINRENQKRYVLITGDTTGRDLGSIVTEINAKLKEITLPQGYSIDFGGEAKEMQDAFVSLFYALILAIVIVYMVMAAEFESLIDPFVIMFTLPLAIIGVIFALFITGHSLSIISYIGVIMLVGIVVNNAIVLIDYINLLRRRGMEKNEAIKEAGVTRLRPILITTITTVVGLLPIALGIGEGAETRAPMAISVIGGLISSTLLTLVVIPVTYSVLESAGSAVKRRIKRIVQGE